jgi:hypothetical protein
LQQIVTEEKELFEEVTCALALVISSWSNVQLVAGQHFHAHSLLSSSNNSLNMRKGEFYK